MWIGSVSEFGIRTCEIKRKWISPASELQVMQLWKSSSITARCWVLLLSELVFSSPAFKTSSPPQKSDPPSTAQLIIGSRDGNLRDILHSTNLWWKRQILLANSGCLYPCSWATMVEAMPEHLANFSMFSIFRASSKMHMIQKKLETCLFCTVNKKTWQNQHGHQTLLTKAGRLRFEITPTGVHNSPTVSNFSS